MQQLERIVIDKCHTVLGSTAEWRPKVSELYQIIEKGVEVVFLTGRRHRHPAKSPCRSIRSA